MQKLFIFKKMIYVLISSDELGLHKRSLNLSVIYTTQYYHCLPSVSVCAERTLSDYLLLSVYFLDICT